MHAQYMCFYVFVCCFSVCVCVLNLLLLLLLCVQMLGCMVQFDVLSLVVLLLLLLKMVIFPCTIEGERMVFSAEVLHVF